MTALEVCYPVPMLILVKRDDLAKHFKLFPTQKRVYNLVPDMR